MESSRRIADFVDGEHAGWEVGREGSGDRALDVRIACEIMGYRWMEWNHDLLRGGTLDAPGRFLTTDDGPFAHLQRPASPAAPISAWPILEVPRFTSRIQDAWSAAVRAGLFDGPGIALVRLEDGRWEVRRPDGGRVAVADSAPFALSRAALAGSRNGDRAG